MILIGLNAYHGDSSAAIVRDGVVVAAAEEERFRRVKHWAGFPSEAIQYCLLEAGLRLSDVDIIAINSDPRANLTAKALYALRNPLGISRYIGRLHNQVKRHSIRDELEAAFPSDRFRGEFRRVEHHLAHLASAFLVSPFREACVASIDGFGDFCSTAWGVGTERSIEVRDRVLFPHSLGIFYQAMTQYLGFPNYGDEYKVMGLAPYGRPEYVRELESVIKLQDRGRFELNTHFFRHQSEDVAYVWDGGAPSVGVLYTSEVEALLGPSRRPNEPLTQRHMDIARSIQEMYEKAFFNLLRFMNREYQIDSLTLAGGCAMNSVANGRVVRETGFKRLYVQAAAGDAGGAIGSAIFAWNRDFGNVTEFGKLPHPGILSGDTHSRVYEMDHAYLGPHATNDDVQTLLTLQASEISAGGCDVTLVSDEAELCNKVADYISRGLVVGWFQGRMEWGPRALGNRSIVCDPRRADMKDILNLKIKRRESFRPFAPSIQKEFVSDWFEEDGDVPFMMQVYQVRDDRRSSIPAVTHVDGSGRLQTVYKGTNRRYWNLIDAFRQITGVPMVLNTSFNENEPVVCTADQALNCFLRTNMDVLVLENWIVVRKGSEISDQ